MRLINAALGEVTAPGMRALYDAIDTEAYGMPLDDEDWDYTWHWFEQAREFYRTAAAAGRAVIFTADQ